MKNSIYILSILIGLFAFAKAESQNNQERDTFEIQVDGLGCPFCAYGLEKKFKEFKGIKDVAIDIETGDFSFTYPAEKSLSMQAVIKQVEKAGYTPNLATITRANGDVETNASNNNEVASTPLQESTLWVNGKCGMCKARIEKAVSNLPGVASATWDVDSKQLTYSHDGSTTVNQVEQKVAQVGHDTKNTKASDQVYDQLPGCCHYKRVQ